MAHWDDEKINTQEPPKDIMCATCKYRLKPVTVAGTIIDRIGYGICDRYNKKPESVLWNHGECDGYEKE